MAGSIFQGEGSSMDPARNWPAAPSGPRIQSFMVLSANRFCQPVGSDSSALLVGAWIGIWAWTGAGAGAWVCTAGMRRPRLINALNRIRTGHSLLERLPPGGAD